MNQDRMESLTPRFVNMILIEIYSHERQFEQKVSTEPDLNQRPKDLCAYHLQSSALPTELSVVTLIEEISNIKIQIHIFTSRFYCLPRHDNNRPSLTIRKGYYKRSIWM